jgi:hypothetical protein
MFTKDPDNIVMAGCVVMLIAVIVLMLTGVIV